MRCGQPFKSETDLIRRLVVQLQDSNEGFERYGHLSITFKNLDALFFGSANISGFGSMVGVTFTCVVGIAPSNSAPRTFYQHTRIQTAVCKSEQRTSGNTKHFQSLVNRNWAGIFGQGTAECHLSPISATQPRLKFNPNSGHSPPETPLNSSKQTWTLLLCRRQLPFPSRNTDKNSHRTRAWPLC